MGAKDGLSVSLSPRLGSAVAGTWRSVRYTAVGALKTLEFSSAYSCRSVSLQAVSNVSLAMESKLC